MKKLLLLSIVLMSSLGICQAQKQIWGSVANDIGSNGYRNGYLFKTDSIGNTLQMVHLFDSINGKNPGVLTLASNGKLYGLTSRGGAGSTPVIGMQIGGVLFEYDLVLDSFVVLHHFNPYDVSFPYANPLAEYGLVEGAPGVLYGTISGSGSFMFKYTIATHTTSYVVQAPGFVGGTYNNAQTNQFVGPVFKASNGFIYAATAGNSTCPVPIPYGGSLVRVNTANNAISTIYINPCGTSNGWQYLSPNLEVNEKLYSAAFGGIYGGTGPTDPGLGVIYEFNISNNVYTKKAEFTGGINGKNPSTMLKATNGNFYGTADGGTPYSYFQQNYPSGSGIIYEFNPNTNIITPSYEFRVKTYGIDSVGEYGKFKLTATNGKIYGTNFNGIFEFDPVTKKAKPRTRSYSNIQGLVEICRKPAYKYYPNTSYTLCSGSPFTLDLKNYNSTSVVWKKNNVAQASQTSPILHFDHITTADAGTWTCTLTNECGTTTPPAIQIVVNAAGAGITTSVIASASTNICPGSSTVISGNNGGIWSTGATTPTITVTNPGQYFVTNANACGNTYSNTITIDTIPSPAIPVAVKPNTMFCPNGSVTLTGNNNGGTWNTGATTPTIQVPAQVGTSYYIVNSHTCGFDTSNVIQFSPYELENTTGAPHIGNIGPLIFCQGGSVTLLNTGYATNTSAQWQWLNASGGFLGFGNNNLVVTTAGSYRLKQTLPICGIVREDTVIVKVDTPPTTPTITAQGPTTFCQGGSVILQSSTTSNLWSTGQTTPTITVTQSGLYHATIQNTCGSVTSTDIQVTVVPTPTVSYTPPTTEYCSNASNVLLSGGSPSGGIYSGNTVFNGYFSPSNAGEGDHNITYTYTDGTGCSASITKTITVYSNQAPVLMSNYPNNTICQGGTILLFQPTYPTVQWNTGQNAQFLLINQAGSYNYTVTNACGTQTSNTITVIVNPVPTITFTQTPNFICTNNGNITLSAANPAGGTYSGNGVNGIIFNPNTAGAGTHNITYSYTENGCTGTAQQTITVGTDTAFVTPLSSTQFCQGDSVVLQANSNQALWSTGITSGSIAVYQSGLYHIINSSACGNITSDDIEVIVFPNFSFNNPQIICSGESYSFHGNVYSIAGNYTDAFQSVSGCDSVITTQLTVNPTYTSNNPQAICEGESYTLNGHTYNINGSYTDVLQSASGCDSTVTTQISITELNTQVIQDGPKLTAAFAGSNFQWINCDNNALIPNANGQFFIATQNGNYAVIISDGTCNDTSTCYQVKNVAVNEYQVGNTIKLYPNPAWDYIQLATDENIESMVIFNSIGQQVMQANQVTQLNIAQLAPGTYFIVAETGKGTWRGKFVKM